MRRPHLGTLFALAACLSLTAIPALAKDRPGFTGAENKALDTYEHCWKVARSDCGRNWVDDGLLLKSGKVRDATKAEVVAWTGRLERIISPPVQAPVAVSSPALVAPAPTTTVAPVSGGACGGITPYEGAGQCWAIPYDIVACESGGSYTAYNPSGASGAYQLMNGGGGSPAEQDAAASALWAGGAGRSNWVC